MKKIDQFATSYLNTWCPGCGNFGLLAGLKKAFQTLSLTPDEVCMFYDIGCSSNMANFLKTYGFNGLHGRSLPAAAGASLANHKMKIIALSGDGGAYGEGLNHFIAACRANYNLTYLVSNNQLYSLTTGQTSPTTLKGRITKSTPFGVIEEPFNPLAAAITSGCSFAARGWSNDLDHLTDLIIKAINHEGFSFIDILSPCVTWNKKIQPPAWYQERIYKLEESGYSREKALNFAFQQPDKLPIGIFYKQSRATYQKEASIQSNEPVSNQPVTKININHLIKEFL